MSTGKLLLVIGGAGYIGSTVVYRALEQGWSVRVLDRLMYGGSSLFRAFAYNDRFELIVRDIRDVDLDALVRGCHCVFNAAALVGEHICKKYPKDAVEINQNVTIEIAKACGRQGVARYVFASTCSNYGKTDVHVDETSPVHPLSLYSSTKINVENFLLSDDCKVAATILRFATIYGLASRVRFDLLIHEFIRDAWTDKRVEIYGPDGWRPFCHVDDAARAVLSVCDHSLTLPPKIIFNVGSNSQNFQKSTIGKLIKQRLPVTDLVLRYDKGDPRSYKVNFEKIETLLGFRCIHKPAAAINDIISGLESGLITLKELKESVNIADDDPIRDVPTGSAMKYAPVKKMSNL
jgi:nucleoside-diphosphate-sugar epimerase